MFSIPPARLHPYTLYALRCPLSFPRDHLRKLERQRKSRPFGRPSTTKCARFWTSVIRFRVTSHERRATNSPRDHLRKRLQKIRIFSNIFNRFALFFEYFRIFSNVFNRFRTFSNATCAFDLSLFAQAPHFKELLTEVFTHLRKNLRIRCEVTPLNFVFQ